MALLVVVDVLSRSQSPTGDESFGGGATPEPSVAGRRGAGARMVVANTHLVFNPKRGDVKTAQLMLLTGRVERQAEIVWEHGKRESRLKSTCRPLQLVEHSKYGILSSE